MKSTMRLSTLLLVFMMMFSALATNVFAANKLADEIPGYKDSKGEVSTYEAYINKHLNDYVIKTFIENETTSTKPDTDYGEFNANTGKDGAPEPHYFKSANGERDLINRIDTNIRTSNAARDADDITGDLGIHANTGAAVHSLTNVAPIVNLFLGIICVVITMLLAIYTAFDVLYISFPAFQNKCNEAKASGATGAMTKTGKSGGTELRWVSAEAQYVVEQCSIQQGQNPLLVYLGKRIVAYISVTIILFILLTGNINIITNLALRIVSYIMDVIAGL